MKELSDLTKFGLAFYYCSVNDHDVFSEALANESFSVTVNLKG